MKDIKNAEIAAAAVSVVEELKIPKLVAAKIFKVTRRTFYRWYEGGGISSDLIAGTASRVVRLLKQAQQHQKLPLPPSFEGDRYTEIMRILREEMNRP